LQSTKRRLERNRNIVEGDDSNVRRTRTDEHRRFWGSFSNHQLCHESQDFQKEQNRIQIEVGQAKALAAAAREV
jgi:hypothetical protein